MLWLATNHKGLFKRLLSCGGRLVNVLLILCYHLDDLKVLVSIEIGILK